MTQKGAELWMYYMKKTLNEMFLVKYYFTHDKRIIPCIKSFFNIFYENILFQFDFNIYNILHNKSKL